MGAQPPALLAAQPAVARARERELRGFAGDEVLELLGQGAARPEDQGLECGLCYAEQRADLDVRPALELAQNERLALGRRNPLQGAHEVVERGRIVVDRFDGRKLLVELDVARARLLLPEALPDQVVRDRDQPVLRCPRPLTRSRARNALTNVVCVTSSASARLPSTA